MRDEDDRRFRSVSDALLQLEPADVRERRVHYEAAREHLPRTGRELTPRCERARLPAGAANERLQRCRTSASLSTTETMGIELNCGRCCFSMVCADDGCGFDTSGAEKANHWGLRAMAERAHKLGGRLQVRSAAGRGTEITASVPSYRAYQHRG